MMKLLLCCWLAFGGTWLVGVLLEKAKQYGKEMIGENRIVLFQ